MIEALVGMLLMAILALGLANALARAVDSQRYVSTQRMAVLKLRNLVASNTNFDTFCASSPSLSMVLNYSAGTPTTVSVPTTVTCPAATSISVGVSGSTSYTETVSFKTQLTFKTAASNSNAISLFGGDGVIQLSQ